MNGVVMVEVEEDVGGIGVIRIFNRGKRIEVGEDFLVEAIVLIVVCSVIFRLSLY